MKKFLTWTFWIVSILLLLFFGTLLVGTRYAKKVAPWPDPVPGVSLTPGRPFLAASNIGPDNAYFYFLQLTNYTELIWDNAVCEELESSRTNGWVSGVFTNLEAWLASNKVIFDVFSKAAAMTNAQAWTVERFGQLIPEISMVLTMDKMCAAAASKAFAERRGLDAASNIQIVLHNNSLFEKGNALFGRLVAEAGDRQVLWRMQPALQAGLVDRDVNEKIAELLEWREATQEPMSETIKYEALIGASMQSLATSGKVMMTEGFCGMNVELPVVARAIAPAFGSHREAMSKHLEAVYSQLIFAADDSSRVAKLKKLFETRFDPSPTWVRCFDDPLGRWTIGMAAPGLTHALELAIKHRSNLRAAVAMLAVERWRMDHGDVPPAAIGDLVPKYLKKIPEDPFAKGANLLYRLDAESYAVYSVGTDGVDSGGECYPDNYSRDVGWRVKLERK